MKDVEGVSIVTTSQKDHEVTVVYEDGDIKKDAIQKKLENAGFYVQSVK